MCCVVVLEMSHDECNNLKIGFRQLFMSWHNWYFSDCLDAHMCGLWRVTKLFLWVSGWTGCYPQSGGHCSSCSSQKRWEVGGFLDCTHFAWWDGMGGRVETQLLLLLLLMTMMMMMMMMMMMTGGGLTRPSSATAPHLHLPPSCCI